MLALSSKSLYGLKALLHLAEYHQGGLLQSKEIAASQHIPQQYLEQIFNLLGKANLVRSVRGKNGGYKLTGDPAGITVKDVILLLEGGIGLLPEGGDPADAIGLVLQQAEKALLQALTITLAELIAMRRAKREIPLYDI